MSLRKGLLSSAVDEQPVALVDKDALRRYMDRESRYWGSLVRARRKTLKLTLAHVAALADTTQQTVHKVERGIITPRDELRIALAIALRTEVAALFPMADNETLRREVVA